jgi:hypothetical protein
MKKGFRETKKRLHETGERIVNLRCGPDQRSSCRPSASCTGRAAAPDELESRVFTLRYGISLPDLSEAPFLTPRQKQFRAKNAKPVLEVEMELPVRFVQD